MEVKTKKPQVLKKPWPVGRKLTVQFKDLVVGNQARRQIDEEKYRLLVESLRTKGQRDEVKVTPSGQITGGYTRALALKELGQPIAVRVETEVEDEFDLVERQLIHNTGEGLSDLDLARSIDDLRRRAPPRTWDEIAATVRLSRNSVKDLHLLLKLDAGVLIYLDPNAPTPDRLPRSIAVVLAKAFPSDCKKQKEFARLALREGLSTERIESRIQRLQAEQPSDLLKPSASERAITNFLNRLGRDFETILGGLPDQVFIDMALRMTQEDHRRFVAKLTEREHQLQQFKARFRKAIAQLR